MIECIVHIDSLDEVDDDDVSVVTKFAAVPRVDEMVTLSVEDQKKLEHQIKKSFYIASGYYKYVRSTGKHDPLTNEQKEAIVTNTVTKTMLKDFNFEVWVAMYVETVKHYTHDSSVHIVLGER